MRNTSVLTTRHFKKWLATCSLRTGFKFWRPLSLTGFTLLEIMVAVSIISIVLVAVYRLHSQTILMNHSVQFYITAPLLAQRRLAELEMQSQSALAEEKGNFGEEFTGYSWKVSISDVAAEMLETTAEDLKKIDVTVLFNQDELVYNLRSYKFIPQ
jgi:general secretion pathway protein I